MSNVGTCSMKGEHMATEKQKVGNAVEVFGYFLDLALPAKYSTIFSKEEENDDDIQSVE